MSLETARELYKIEGNKKWILENFSEEELFPKELVKSWRESIHRKAGYYIDSRISEIKNLVSPNNEPQNHNVFRTKKEANAYGLVAAQLSQIIADANGDWEPDWKNVYQSKFIIEPNGDATGFNIIAYGRRRQHFPMKSREIAEACLEKHCDLWEQFYMIK